MPSALKTSSKLDVNFASRSEQAPNRLPLFVELQSEIAGLLDDPRSDRVGGDSGQMHSPGVELDEEEHVEPLRQHRVDREEVAGQQRRCLSTEELGPGGTRPLW